MIRNKLSRKDYEVAQRVQESMVSVSSRTLSYNIHTLWLFGRDQLKDTIIPSTAFATFAALSGPVLDMDTSLLTVNVLQRVPIAFLWVWINVLLFCLHNQRRPESVLEDTVNKPWRPIPAKRITAGETTRVLLGLYPFSYFFSWCQGVLGPCALLTSLTIWYNDLGGADRSGVIRNFLNAAGFSCFHSGALKIVVEPDYSVLSPRAFHWLLSVASLIFTTIHIQDFRDRPGDSLRGRSTVLSALGDEASRWTLVIGIVFWSLIMPWYWEAGVVGFLPSSMVGTIIILRLLTQKNVPADSVTYQIWAFWCLSFYPLPWIVYYLRSRQ